MSRRRVVSASAIGSLLAASACAPITPDPRVPLPIPLPTVEGATPATGAGFFFAMSFGDGFWGTERERAELFGIGMGASVLARFEMEWHAYHSNRTIDDKVGRSHAGSPAETFRLKARVLDVAEDAVAVGIALSWSTASRFVINVQDEHATAWDLAFPIEYTELGDSADPHRLALYAGPRLIHQSFESDLVATPEPRRDTGMAWGGFAGAKVRYRWLHFAAEGSLMRAPGMRVGEWASVDGWMFVPALNVKFVLPFGDGDDRR